MKFNNKLLKKTIIFLIIFTIFTASSIPAEKQINNTEKITKNKTTIDEPNIIIPDDYASIKEGLNNAGTGDIIFVRTGTYEENQIIIDKTITLISESKEDTIIKGLGPETILKIKAEDVIINGFTFQENTSSIISDIMINADNCNLTNMIIKNSEGIGIKIIQSKNCIIQFSSLININNKAILFENSDENIISNNQIESCRNGIFLNHCNKNNITKNEITQGLAGIYSYNSSEQKIEQNTIKECSKAIYLEESNENYVQNNHIQLNTQGMFLSYSSGNEITSNNLLSNEENAKFTTWLAPEGIHKNQWKKNYWDDNNLKLVKIIPGILFIPTEEQIGIFFPWYNIDWNPSKEIYEL